MYLFSTFIEGSSCDVSVAIIYREITRGQHRTGSHVIVFLIALLLHNVMYIQ